VSSSAAFLSEKKKDRAENVYMARRTGTVVMSLLHVLKLTSLSDGLQAHLRVLVDEVAKEVSEYYWLYFPRIIV